MYIYIYMYEMEHMKMRRPPPRGPTCMASLCPVHPLFSLIHHCTCTVTQLVITYKGDIENQ